MEMREGADAHLKLRDHASNWPTPQTMDTMDVVRKPEDKNPNGGCVNLREYAANWPTPRADKTTSEDATTWQKRNDKGDVSTPPLTMSAENWPTTPPHGTTTGLGLLLQQWTPPSCPRLNPRMAAWLMGHPHGLISFALSETAWTLWSQRMRSLLCGLVSQWEINND